MRFLALAFVSSAFGFLVQPPASSAVRPTRTSPVLLAEAGSAKAVAAAALAAAVISSVGVYDVNAALAPAATVEASPATIALLAKQTTDWTAADFDWDSIGNP